MHTISTSAWFYFIWIASYMKFPFKRKYPARFGPVQSIIIPTRPISHCNYVHDSFIRFVFVILFHFSFCLLHWYIPILHSTLSNSFEASIKVTKHLLIVLLTTTVWSVRLQKGQLCRLIIFFFTITLKRKSSLSWQLLVIFFLMKTRGRMCKPHQKYLHRS